MVIYLELRIYHFASLLDQCQAGAAGNPRSSSSKVTSSKLASTNRTRKVSAAGTVMTGATAGAPSGAGQARDIRGNLPATNVT